VFVVHSAEAKRLPVDKYKIKTVVIDAGHGGKDPGAIGYSKVQEKDVTLAVSLKLGELIKKHYPEIKVVYTRDKDVFVELQERAAIANKANADLFISIHCNANNDRNAYGTETYCLGLHRSEANLEVAKRENSVILLEDNYVEKYDGFDPNAPEAHIIFSLFQYAFINQSVSFASKIDNQLTVTSSRKSRGVKQAGFLVLYKTTMPGVLIELGFISNKNEEAFLKSTYGQESVALGIFNAFSAYKKEIQGDKEALNIKPEKTPPPAPTNVAEKKDTIKTELNTPINTPKEIEKPTVVEKNIKTDIPEKTTPIKTEDKPVVTETKVISPEKVPDENPVNSYIFKVQFAASKVKLPVDEPRLKKVLEYEIEKADNGYLRYLSGKFISLKTAESQKDVLRQIGFTDAFIVPYENGTKRITINEYLEKKEP
jgi:N-acetylmuramoyl-L-alanine amidase